MARMTIRGRAARSVIGVLVLTGSIGFAGIAATASVSGAAEAGIQPNFSNKLSATTSGWCNNPADAPCDGANNDYGTIDIVKKSFDNLGGYAAHVPTPGKFARVSGNSGTSGTEGATGCTNPGDENCSGPYTKFEATPASYDVFPSKGVTTSLKIYIDSTWAAANPGQVVDWDMALNDTTGTYLEDFAFNLCSTAANGGGFYVSVSNGAGGCSTGPTELTTGWYTFKLNFAVTGGTIYPSYSVLDATNTAVFSAVDTVSQHQVATTGDVRYGWLADEDVQGLPISALSLKTDK